MTHDARAALCHSVQAAMPDIHDQMDLSMSKMAKSAVMRKIGMQDQIDLDLTPVAAAAVIYYALYGYLIGSQTVAEQFAEKWMEENAHEGPTYEYLKGVLDGPTLSVFAFLDGELGPMEVRLRDLLTGEEYLVVDELLANNSLQGKKFGQLSGYLVPVRDFHVAIGSLIPILVDSQERIFAWHSQRGGKRIDRKARSELALLLARRNLMDILVATDYGKATDKELES